MEEFERPHIKYYAKSDCSPDHEIVGSIKESDLILKCSVCEKPAVAFWLDESGVLWINSAIRSFPLTSPLPNRLSMLLEDLRAGKYQKVHEALARVCDGLDYYCPTCDRMYCADHYHVRPEFEEGFYDCSWGICFKGHARIMDD